jgi:hypothetical protein
LWGRARVEGGRRALINELRWLWSVVEWGILSVPCVSVGARGPAIEGLRAGVAEGPRQGRARRVSREE